MGGLEHTVLLGVDECSLLLSVGSPEQENNTREVVIDPADDCISQVFPTLRDESTIKEFYCDR